MLNQIGEFFKGLFDTNRWPARWHCGYWSDFHGWLYIISDLMIWFAYFSIPVIILNYFLKKRVGLKFHKIYFLFAAFIMLCGSTHFLDAVMFWAPFYRFNALVRLATGVVSLFTVYYMIKILPDAFKQKTNLELEFEIARREEAERKLQEANKGLESFAYIASHDLQEPLRKIRTYSSLLNRADTLEFDNTYKDYTKKIEKSTVRMQSMVQDILKLSSIDYETELESLRAEEAINSAREDLEIKILESEAEINISRIPEVVGNKVYLTQLFANLLSNSIKFSTNTPIINISAEKKGDKVFIYFADNGIGMREEDTKKIFNAFERLNAKHKYEGSGIGLAICKKIVDLHNGRIYAESKPDNGTIFTIELPAA